MGFAVGKSADTTGRSTSSSDPRAIESPDGSDSRVRDAAGDA